MNLKRARQVLKIESEAIKRLIPRLDNKFLKALDLLYRCKGRIVVTGMGKAGIIGQKISATLSSTGTPSLWLHSAEASHGDLGRIRRDDCVLALSNSGETEELKNFLPIIKKIGVKLISITGAPKSTLGRFSDVVVDASIKYEACPLGLAPTASTTVMLALGDALAVCLLEKKGFKEKDFAFYHPGGALGKRLLLTVGDIMRSGKSSPVVLENTPVSKVLFAITKARAGSASIIDKKGRLVGIFTDGDLRRHLGKDATLPHRRVSEVMTRNPRVIKKDCLAAEALRILQEKKIDELPVVDNKAKPLGLVDVQDILKAGIV
ncbi:MAG: KpsF/GutQ family sugar-phosphate isomerase [Candidatus Omnitrophica bacterium]|nr:KpsF/GutQ family sugar-phosphate isomerase [Candidatus Omnitrophota bacterium]